MIRAGLVPQYKGLSVLDANGITWHAMSGYAKRRNVASNGAPKDPVTTELYSTNYAVNPSFEGSLTSWSATGGTVIQKTSFPQMTKSGTNIAEFASDGTVVVPSLSVINATYRPAVTPGQWVGLTAFIATEMGYEVRVQINWRDAAGATISNVASAWMVGSFYTGANPQIVAQAPALTASVGYYLQYRNPADQVSMMTAGKRMWADAVSVSIAASQEECQARTNQAYFDGSTANTDLITAWTGTAHLSTSTMMAPITPVGWSYFVGTGETGDSMWRKLPGPDGRLGMARREIWIPKTSGSTGWQYTENIAGVAGDTYTAQMLLSCPNSLSSKLRISFYNASTLVNSVDSGFFNLTGGVPSKANVTAAATGPFTNIRVWFYHTTGSTPASGNYDALRCQIEPGTEMTDWFDGATAADENYIYSWEGAAFASPSVATP